MRDLGRRGWKILIKLFLIFRRLMGLDTSLKDSIKLFSRIKFSFKSSNFSFSQVALSFQIFNF